MTNNLILKCVVGSQAHGLADENSDTDYRGVYVTPTRDILTIGYKYKGSNWIEDKEDQTTYEISHFLDLALKCNPSILEVFVAPIQEGSPLGYELRDLFSDIWNPNDAFNAFTGYSYNQRKKLLEKKDGRPKKFAVAYLRTLWNLCDLLEKESFSLEIKDPKFKQQLLDIKYCDVLDIGYVINEAEGLTETAKNLLEGCKHEANPKKVNDFLLKVRKNNW